MSTTERPRAARRHDEGYVHFGSMAGFVRWVPGTRRPAGQRHVAVLMEEVLDRVRRRLDAAADARSAR